MRSRDPRNLLTRALEGELFPELRRIGFAGPMRERWGDDDVAPWRDDQLLFHFGRQGPGVGRVVLTVAVKPNSRPTFEVFAGHVPEEGVRLLAPPVLVTPERVTADMLRDQVHLQAGRGEGYSPFRQPLWAYAIGSGAGIRGAVRKALARLPLLLRGLESNAAAKHVRAVRHPTAPRA